MTPIIWGVAAGGHDASLAVFRGHELAFAAHAERYSRVKNDPELHPDLVQDALKEGPPDKIVWYENGWLKRLRHLRAGQWRRALGPVGPRAHLVRHLPRVPATRSVGHHHAHAAAGYFTSPFRTASILVLDAIGELETLTIWRGEGRRLTKIFAQSYPHSVGLFYSAITQRCGFKPNEEEYVLMGMAALGDPGKYYAVLRQELLDWTPGRPGVRALRNLHRGCREWRPEITDHANLAAAAQAVYEDVLLHLCTWTRQNLPSGNLVVMGGCALNCVANTKVARTGVWDGLWIFPNPGDAGSSVGAVLAECSEFVAWKGPYVGHCIPGTYRADEVVDELLRSGVAGIAAGPAEFGPRALGNRSLLADPRLPAGKGLINRIKRREPFRPFAPALRLERARELFDMPVSDSPYMQFVARCRQPARFPAVVHVDGTSRLQTVTREQNPAFYDLLGAWERTTGCPILLNTSLNIKGEPLVNTEEDARRFTESCGVRVF